MFVALGAVVISSQCAACIGRLDVGRVGDDNDRGNGDGAIGVQGSGSNASSGVASQPSSGSSSGSASSSGASGDGSSSGNSGSGATSCQSAGPGLTNCGPGGSGSESCCASLEVTGGKFFRTYTNNGTGPYVPGEADPATVSSLRLDKYLVTLGRFSQLVEALNMGWLPPAESGKHTDLNGGKGLVNAGDLSGVAYEPGWVASDDGNIALTNGNLADPACTLMMSGGDVRTFRSNVQTGMRRMRSASGTEAFA